MLNKAASNSILTNTLFNVDHMGMASIGPAGSIPPKHRKQKKAEACKKLVLPLSDIFVLQSLAHPCFQRASLEGIVKWQPGRH